MGEEGVTIYQCVIIVLDFVATQYMCQNHVI